MLEIGSLVDGKYKILSEIGHGGMSVVYMAINEKANRTWAVKEVRRDGVLDYRAVRQGLLVETDMLKHLKHPNLPGIIDVIEDEESLLIVMDYIEGKSLWDTLEEFGAQPEKAVIEWAKQLCAVLGYLHTREPAIIYRDMKPKNIMLSPKGDHVTLIDFGTAREYKESNTKDTISLGTVGYAAPEQYGGMGQTDARTDIFNLGATLHHLVTGSDPSDHPFEFASIKEFNGSLSDGLEYVIQKCVQQKADDRYQSAAELMYDLEHIEEIGKEHRKRQKRKLAGFIIPAVLSVGMAIAGVSLNYAALLKATDNYEEYLKDAAESNDDSLKVELYQKCIAVPGKAGEKDAYLGLINLFKTNSEEPVFTVTEQDVLIKLIKTHREELKENKENYVDICFEMGKLFWYYYDYGDGSDNRLTKMKAAIEWFSEVKANAAEDYENLGMAEVYSSVGEFYRDININTVEASDKGLYLPHFEKLNVLVDSVCTDDGETEMVKLELLDLTRSALQQYAIKFKADEVSAEEALLLYDKVEQNLDAIKTDENTADVIREKKERIKELMGDTKATIKLAYGIKEGEE